MRVITMPRASNPYQDELHRALRERGLRPRYLPEPTRSHSVNLLLLPLTLAVLRVRGVEVLHLHWVYGFSFPGSGRSRLVARFGRLWFTLFLLITRVLGLRLVWTAHNVLPHRPVFDDDAAGRRALIRRADHVLLHEPFVLDELSRLTGGAEPVAWSVGRHPSYLSYVQSSSPSGATRERLGICPRSRVIAMVGRVTRDKGADLLAAAARRVAGDLTVVIAGHCDDPGLAGTLEAHAADDPRIRVDLRFLSDTEVADYLGAADAVVLPFRAVTTSGSALMAMTYGLAAALPRLPAFDSIPLDVGPRFDAEDPQSLGEAITAIVDADPDTVRGWGERGRQWASSATWDDLAEVVHRAYDAPGARTSRWLTRSRTPR